MNLIELKAELTAATSQAEALLKDAEATGMDLTKRQLLGVSTARISALEARIASAGKNNTMAKNFPSLRSHGIVMTDGPRGKHLLSPPQQFLSEDYIEPFYQMIRTKGTQVSAALYEGSDGAGGYAVPIVVDDQIVPLAPQEMAVRQLATVIPTTSDIKFPVKATFGSATAKAELSSFTESEPTLSQFTLSAYMAGVLQEISWELAQDVPAFQAFAVDDMILDQQMYEENLYINGTGSGQAQGLIGNVGSGFGPQEPDSNGNLVSIAGLLNIQGTLNAVYQKNASWLMARSTSIIIRKAQMESNLFYPAFTRDGDGTDRLFGFPVAYAQAMPTAARGSTPVLFGDFKRGYIIGDRGGSGINVKVLDQPLASQGILQLLAYRRTDGRVRRSEAIQSYTIASS